MRVSCSSGEGVRQISAIADILAAAACDDGAGDCGSTATADSSADSTYCRTLPLLLRRYVSIRSKSTRRPLRMNSEDLCAASRCFLSRTISATLPALLCFQRPQRRKRVLNILSLGRGVSSAPDLNKDHSGLPSRLREGNSRSKELMILLHLAHEIRQRGIVV